MPMPLLRRFLRDESGATALEYGLIMALMFLVFIGAVAALGNTTGDLFDRASEKLRAAMGG